MLLFKSKKYDEILPPPPPSLDMEPEEKPKLFDEVIEPKKSETFPEEDEFRGLLEGLDDEKPKKSGKITLKKAVAQKKQKIPQIKSAPLKKIAKTSGKSKIFLEMEKDFGLKELDFEFPKELEKPEEELELPETLDEFGIEDLSKELQQKTEKPKEISEAEEEIKSAIEKIREHEKPSFFKKLFTKKKKEEEMPEEQITLEVDDVSAIQNKINEARQALMEFNLEKARRNYIEAMNLYNRINPEEQAKVYNDIKELYFERKSAEGLKV